MIEPSRLPAVLFVTPCAFNTSTGGGVTFSNLFRGWPKDRLATVHCDSVPTSSDVCERYFVLGPDELRRRWPFNWLASATGASAPGQAAAEEAPTARQASLPHRLKRRVFGDGVPELARLSPKLEAYIEAFRPQLLYTILGGNGIVDLIELVQARWRLPLVVHVMDDWRDTVYGNGWLSPWQRGMLNRKIRRLMQVASRRFGICDAMADAMARDYGVPFQVFQNGIDTARWHAVARTDTTPLRPARLLYSGAMLPFAQAEAVIEAAQTVDRLAAEGMEIAFDIHCPSAHAAAYRDRLSGLRAVRLRPQFAAWDDYVAAVATADMLLLPVNFDAASVRYIRYSMPTKVPEYLASGTPVLVYGPAEVAQVEYALRDGWGLPVTARDPVELAAAIRRLTQDTALRARLSARARRLAVERHDLNVLRAGFRESMLGAAA